ncbi:hypothetical protein [Egbenema bharatensis]|uniref:hypothetical protein n=1 Tax=Egbenema bharatensis TaxID=3463334 RepID=UPI003A886E00
MHITDYRTLPTDVKRELVFDYLKFNKACVALAATDNTSPEQWSQTIGCLALQQLKEMHPSDIETVINLIYQARYRQENS